MDQKKLVQEKKAKLIELTSAFCREHADDEYRRLSEKLIDKMSRKRSVPFLTGGLNVWAAGVIHALGSINFLFDSSFPPYATLDDIAEFFGCAKSTMGNKSKQIRDMFRMQHFDPEFSIKSMAAEGNRLKNMLAATLMPPEIVIVWDGEPQENDGHPGRPELNDIVSALFATGPTLAIEKRLRSLVERYPEFADAYYQLAEVCSYQGKTSEANELRKRAAELEDAASGAKADKAMADG